MWEFLSDWLLIELIDRLPKPLRIGVWIIMGLALAALFLWLFLR